jgi:hypothetical protein
MYFNPVQYYWRKTLGLKKVKVPFELKPCSVLALQCFYCYNFSWLVTPVVFKMKKKILIALLCLIPLYIILLQIEKYEKSKIDHFWKEKDKIIVGMKEADVIKIIGQPRNEEWVNSDSIMHLDDDSKQKYKRLLKLTFCPKTYFNKDCGLGVEVFLDLKDGKVIAINLFMM